MEKRNATVELIPSEQIPEEVCCFFERAPDAVCRTEGKLYLLMDRKMDHLRIEGGKTGMELKLKNEQLAESTSRVRHLEGENRELHARAEAQMRELQLLHPQMAEESQRHTGKGARH